MDLFVNFTEFEPARLTLESPKPRTSRPEPGKDKGIGYVMANLNYLYKLPDGKEIKSGFLLQLCEVKAYGIQSPNDQYKDYQIKVIFDKNRNDVQNCLKVLDVVHARMVDLITDNSVKGALKTNKVNAQLAKENGASFKKLYHLPEDKATGEIDHNKNPTQFYKLSTYENNKSKFITLDNNKKTIILDWKVMEKAEYSGIPLIHFSHVFSNGTNISPQYRIASIAITDLKFRGSTSAQTITLLKEAEINQEIISNVMAGYADIISKLSVSGSSSHVNVEDKKGEPLTSNPTELNDFMKSSNYAGPIEPKSEPIKSELPVPQFNFSNLNIAGLGIKS